MTLQDKSGPTFDDLGESPVLSKLDALIRRHRPAGVGAPVLTEQVSKPPRISAGFPQLIDPDPTPVHASAAEPILTFDFPPMEEPPLLLEIDDLDVDIVTQDISLAPPAPVVAIPDAVPEAPLAKSAATLYWEEETTKSLPITAKDIQPAPVEVPATIDNNIPDLSLDSIPVLDESLPEQTSDSSFDAPPETPASPTHLAELEEDETEAALAQPISSLMDAILHPPTMAESTEPAVEHHDEVPVLTELALEYDDQLLPLLNATSRAEWVSEMVDDIIAEITPKIRGLVRAQLGLQIGSLMKTVTDEVSKQLQENWRKELKRKIEKRVIDEVDANLHQHITGHLPPDNLATGDE